MRTSDQQRRDPWLEGQRPLLGDATLTTQDGRGGRRLWSHLPLIGGARIGRCPDSLLPVDDDWMPQLLVAVQNADEHGWVLTAGTGVTIDVSGARVQARVLPSGDQLLSRGVWRLTFPTLDHQCRLDVRIYPPDRAAPTDPNMLSRPREVALEDLLVTRPAKRTAADMIGMTVVTRHRLAVLFRHLLEDRPAPANLCAAAGAALNQEEDAVRRMAYRVRDRLNEHRSNPLTSLDDLGDFLVFTGQVLNPDHLEPPAAPTV